MDPNQGNPYMQGANPFMQTPPPPVKGAPQAPDPMAPLDPSGLADPMGGGSSETTKPRQMPGGADPMGGMPAPGGVPAMNPLGGEPTSDTNVPQPAMDARAKLVAIRREVRASNPDLSIRDAHEIAVQAVALLKQAASPMGPVAPMAPTGPNQAQQRPRILQQQVVAPGTRPLPQGDSGNPMDRKSVTHSMHPHHRVYFPNGLNPHNQVHGEEGKEEDDGLWRSRYNGRNPLQDRANAAGYQGKYPHMYGLGDAVLQHATDRMSERKQRRGAP